MLCNIAPIQKLSKSDELHIVADVIHAGKTGHLLIAFGKPKLVYQQDFLETGDWTEPN